MFPCFRRYSRHFNPRSREGSDNFLFCSFTQALKFQSTLPRRERLFTRLLQFLPHLISIHAPAKGATCTSTSFGDMDIISIHAPAKGATFCDCISHNICKFQSTLPRRERLSSIFSPIPLLIISIHAPAKGATKEQMHNYLC